MAYLFIIFTKNAVSGKVILGKQMLPEQQKSLCIVNHCLSKNVFVPTKLPLFEEDLKKAVICMMLERPLHGNE